MFVCKEGIVGYVVKLGVDCFLFDVSGFKEGDIVIVLN